MSTPSQPEQRKRRRANTVILDNPETTWQPPAASEQFRELMDQSHIRPGANVTREPKDSPDDMLLKFLRSNETYEVNQPSDPQESRRTSQGLLREILADERWTRRMVEDFYKRINPSLGGIGQSLTPHPFHRTLYLVLLNALEDQDNVIADRESQITMDEELGDFVQPSTEEGNKGVLHSLARNRASKK